MDRARKEQVVSELKEVFKNSGVIVAAKYAGITVAEMSDLRNKMRENSANVRVAKNRLARIAIEKSPPEGMKHLLVDQIVLMYSEDPVTAAKISVEFAKKIIEKNFGLIKSNHRTSGPSKYFECKNINLTVGFISPISNHFCSTCNRLRVTSNGKIFPCLGDNGSEDLVPFLGTDQEIQLKNILSNVIFNKPEKHYFDVNKKSYIKERFMNTTGG